MIPGSARISTIVFFQRVSTVMNNGPSVGSYYVISSEEKIGSKYIQVH
jgi:hypothetical protein